MIIERKIYEIVIKFEKSDHPEERDIMENLVNIAISLIRLIRKK